MSGSEMASQADLETRLAWLKRKLKAREKVLQHLEQRLTLAPTDKHWLFLRDEHEKARADLWTELRQLERERQGAHPLTQWVDDYLTHWEEPEDSVFGTLEKSTSPVLPLLSPEQQHELETWQGLLRKVEARLLRLPGDPRLLALRESHRARIQALQGSEPAPSAPSAPPPSEQQESPSVSQTEQRSQMEPSEQQGGRTRAQIEKELEIWHQLVKKSQDRLAAKPELLHLRGMIAEHQQKIAALQAELAALNSSPGD